MERRREGNIVGSDGDGEKMNFDSEGKERCGGVYEVSRDVAQDSAGIFLSMDQFCEFLSSAAASKFSQASGTYPFPSSLFSFLRPISALLDLSLITSIFKVAFVIPLNFGNYPFNPSVLLPIYRPHLCNQHSHASALHRTVTPRRPNTSGEDLPQTQPQSFLETFLVFRLLQDVQLVF